MLMALTQDGKTCNVSIDLEGSLIRLTIENGSELPKVRKVKFDAFLWELTKEVSLEDIVACIARITENLPSF